MLTVSEERDDYCLLMIDAAEMKCRFLSDITFVEIRWLQFLPVIVGCF